MGNSDSSDSNNKSLKIEDCINKKCPWSKLPVSSGSLTLYKGHVVGFCNTGCRNKFEKATKHFDMEIQNKKNETDAKNDNNDNNNINKEENDD